MLREIAESILEKQYIVSKSLVLLGLSGGGDSVFLFHVLRQMQEKLDFCLLAVHVNHGIRGKEADADEEFVKELCEKYQVPLEIVKADVVSLAKQRGCSLEEAGRNVRYEAFYRLAEARIDVCSEICDVRIMLAHHANDQEETVFMNFLRGAGVRGLAGMQEMRYVKRLKEKPVYFIRPLLPYTHEQLLATLREMGYLWCEDGTNQEADCVRNYLRLVMLPQIKQELAPAFTNQCVRNSVIFAEIEEYLCEQAEQFLSEHGRKEKEGYLADAEELGRIPPALCRYVIRHCVVYAGGSLTNLSSVHVQEVLELVSAQSGREIWLPGGMRVRKDFGSLVFWNGEMTEGEDIRYELSASIFEKSAADFMENLEKYKSQPYTKWFDCDKIQEKCFGEKPVLRMPRKGDYLVINENGQTKTLKRYLMQEKISAIRRERVPVVAAGSHILWVVGYRTSEAFRITEHTKQILKITVKLQSDPV